MKTEISITSETKVSEVELRYRTEVKPGDRAQIKSSARMHMIYFLIAGIRIPLNFLKNSK